VRFRRKTESGSNSSLTIDEIFKQAGIAAACSLIIAETFPQIGPKSAGPEFHNLTIVRLAGTNSRVTG
jgi:hypothetical protein